MTRIPLLVLPACLVAVAAMADPPSATAPMPGTTSAAPAMPSAPSPPSASATAPAMPNTNMSSSNPSTNDMSSTSNNNPSASNTMSGTAPATHAANAKNGAKTHMAKRSNSGPSKTAREADRATTALELLEANGDRNFKDFHADGHNYAATVTGTDGKTHNVTIDPDSHKVARSG